jgi:AcrR family transcriptional regulator
MKGDRGTDGGRRSEGDPFVSGGAQAALVEALVGLCAAKEYASITVADIARKAGLNRSTFYLYFEDKDDLVERGFELFLSSLSERFKERPMGMGEEDWLIARLVGLFELVDERRAFFMALFSGMGMAPLYSRATAFLEKFLLELRVSALGHAAGPHVPPEPVLARAILSTLLGLISYWLDNPRAASAADMAAYYLRFALGGIRASGYGSEVAALPD